MIAQTRVKEAESVKFILIKLSKFHVKFNIEKKSGECVNTLNRVSKNMDMERAITNARTLYNMTRDHELKVVMDRAELCWCKWRDDSDYHTLVAPPYLLRRSH
jgi:hypothetical protein